MESTANLRHIRISPKKVTVVATAIRGRSVLEAEGLLRTTPKKASRYLLKLLLSAVANARQKSGIKKEDLTISEVRVDGGPMLKRGQPVSRGVWHPILKRTSHISIKLKEAKEK